MTENKTRKNTDIVIGAAAGALIAAGALVYFAQGRNTLIELRKGGESETISRRAEQSPTTQASQRGIDIENLLPGYSLIATFSSNPQGALVYRKEGLEDIVSFVSRNSKDEPYSVYAHQQGKEVRKVCDIPIQKEEIIVGIPVSSVDFGKNRYDSFAFRNAENGGKIGVKIYETDLSSLNLENRTISPRPIYNEEDNFGLVFPAIASEKYLVLADENRQKFVILDLVSARDAAEKGKPLSYFSEGVINVSYDKINEISEDLRKLIGKYKERGKEIIEMDRRAKRDYPIRVTEVEEGDRGRCCIGVVPLKQGGYGLIKYDSGRAGEEDGKK